jgi:hypothetical protein
VTYSLPPTTESITQDSAFGQFNACVDGGRYRADWRVQDGLVVSGQGAFYQSRSERDGGGCTASGTGIVPAGASKNDYKDRVVDAFTGVQWDFENNSSRVYATLGARDDQRPDAVMYREGYVTYVVSKYLGDAMTVELNGRHRLRYEEGVNKDDAGEAQSWREGEHYTALKIAPKWVITQGVEYTTNNAFPTYYYNGNLLYRFWDGASNVRLFAGQQRGGLRCVSGVCRIFPAYEGVRAELTIRF